MNTRPLQSHIAQSPQSARWPGGDGRMQSDGRYRLDDFELYRIARDFRCGVYRIIKQLPSAERFCLDPQVRKAIVSVTNSIAEGHGRWHYKENIHFLQIARGSTEEIIDDLNVCVDEGYAPAE